MGAERLERAVLEKLINQVLAPAHLGGVLERLGEDHNEDQLTRELTEARTHPRTLEDATSALVDAVEQLAPIA